MNRTVFQGVLLSLCMVALTACQSFGAPSYATRLKLLQNELKHSNASVYCTGVKLCEFERINKTPIMDARTHQLSSQSLQQGIIRLQGSVFSQRASMYLSLPEDQYEMVIRFYPISPDRAETFHVIQKFKANQSYTFKMYRDRSKHRNGSLLNVSEPEPLCVVLKEGQHDIRRFCRPFNAVTGLGEFVEQKL